MIVQAQDMVRDVRIAMDQNREDCRLLDAGDEDTLNLDELIHSKLEEAVRQVELEAPARLLESGHDFCRGEVYIGEDGKGFITLPDDFLRLVAFRMSDWRRSVYAAISESDPEYALQSSRWKGVCGSPEKPVCALVRRSEGLVLEFYSCQGPEASVAQATYVANPRIDADGGIDVAEGCYRAAVYRAASLTDASLGDQQFATMLEISKTLLQ